MRRFLAQGCSQVESLVRVDCDSSARLRSSSRPLRRTKPSRESPISGLPSRAARHANRPSPLRLSSTVVRPSGEATQARAASSAQAAGACNRAAAANARMARRRMRIPRNSCGPRGPRRRARRGETVVARIVTRATPMPRPCIRMQRWQRCPRRHDARVAPTHTGREPAQRRKGKGHGMIERLHDVVIVGGGTAGLDDRGRAGQR